MKLIEKIAGFIEDELEGAEEYIKCAINNKIDYPNLAKTFYELSVQELGHNDALHSQVVRIIEDYKVNNGEPPEEMLAVYNYLHERYVRWANKIKLLQAEYRT